MDNIEYSLTEKIAHARKLEDSPLQLKADSLSCLMHAYLHDTNRVNYVSATDDEALNAFQLCSKLEGIIPALEPSHAIAFALKQAAKMSKDKIMIINVCGRGDKDIFTVAEKLGVKL